MEIVDRIKGSLIGGAIGDALGYPVEFMKVESIKNKSWIFDLKELNERRAPGNTCLSALSNSEMGTIEKPINKSKGCGGVMRVAPVGLYFKPSDYMTLDRVGQISAKISAITHGHPLGIIPAYVLAALINDITYNENFTLEEHVENAMKCFRKNWHEKNVSA